MQGERAKLEQYTFFLLQTVNTYGTDIAPGSCKIGKHLNHGIHMYFSLFKDIPKQLANRSSVIMALQTVLEYKLN